MRLDTYYSPCRLCHLNHPQARTYSNYAKKNSYSVPALCASSLNDQPHRRVPHVCTQRQQLCTRRTEHEAQPQCVTCWACQEGEGASAEKLMSRSNGRSMGFHFTTEFVRRIASRTNKDKDFLLRTPTNVSRSTVRPSAAGAEEREQQLCSNYSDRASCNTHFATHAAEL